MVHFTDYWLRYLIFSAGWLLGISLQISTRGVPAAGWRRMLRAAGAVAIGILNFILLYDLMVFEPISPLVVAAVCAAVLWVVARYWKKWRRHGAGHPEI
ncbi:MAG TPA: hypothetical protein PKN95_10525 [Verrucomicrobiota bacterium]|nr:hypothetical protein [Verrucomicrobiota bacterium]HNT14775.1 hypothetical protein [Verrucomicrobiota bacterium]